ncbi:MAG TPA: GNAT family N-acetyltransferase [Candidatus Limnocylindrales bacterium]
MISLRPVEEADIEVFYEHQADQGAAAMAAFPARDRAAHFAHWAKNVLGNPAGTVRTVLVDGAVAGNVVSWIDTDLGRLLGYWIGRDFWGRGVATEALRLYLGEVSERPIRAFVALHNVGSQRVLEKNGFVRVSAEPEIAPDGVAELLFVLN